MNLAAFDPPPGRRPVWLVTLADLSLLLIGFFVLLHAAQDPTALARGLRQGFDGRPEPMPVDIAFAGGFATGSSALATGEEGLAAWAWAAARDPRTVIRVTGLTDGTSADVDTATGSRAVLAVDRARSVARMLLEARAVAPDRIAIAASDEAGRRGVMLTLGFAGNRQEPAAAPLPPGERR